MRWWRFVVASELRKIFAFRVDFWATFLGQTIVQLSIARALWGSIFEASGKQVMEGYTLPMMTLYFLIVPIGNRILQGENMGFLSREIYDGTFNRYLIYPLSFFHYKTITYLTYSFFYSTQLILIYLLFQGLFGDGITMMGIQYLLMGAGLYMVASFVFVNMSIMTELLALWAENVWSLSVMVRFFTYFLGGSYFPVEFFPTWLQAALKYTPFPYLISLPVRTVMGVATTFEMATGLLVLLLWGIFFQSLNRMIWSRGQYHYSGVGI